MTDLNETLDNQSTAVNPRAAQGKIDSKTIHEGGYVERERYWVDSFAFFKQHGYLLRPRYRPGWKPKWNPDESLRGYEDAITPDRRTLMDAKRISDGILVMFKRVPKSSTELEVAEIFATYENRLDARNHCVPLLDVLRNETDPNNVILVFPLLRGIEDPPVASVRESIEFISQTLEGLSFMHEHLVAHRDCAIGNIMMDGRLLFPGGWHPMAKNLHYDGQYLFETGSENPSRTAVGEPRYYFIDFGISTWGQPVALGLDGQERAPELSDKKPYDPFLLDIYILGMVYQKYLLDKHKGLEFIVPLVNDMTHQNPIQRPKAIDALARLEVLKGKLKSTDLSQRLHPLEPEPAARRIYRDVVYHIQDTLWRIKPKQNLPLYEPSNAPSSASTD